MTIAACYLSPEGLVLGADSTTTIGNRHYNHGQKIFEIGEGSTLGIVTWGLGALEGLSYRTLLARFAEGLGSQQAPTMRQIAERWADHFWAAYRRTYESQIDKAKDLHAKLQDGIRRGEQDPLPEDEWREFLTLQGLSGGFCLGGHLPERREPEAFVVTYGTFQDGPGVSRIPPGSAQFWGMPDLVTRAIFGADDAFLQRIMKSGKWTGTLSDLHDLVFPSVLWTPSNLPVREAIDWIYSAILMTIKLMKFSQMAPVCGGPVELAVITTDRPFRWVRHKAFTSAIGYTD